MQKRNKGKAQETDTDTDRQSRMHAGMRAPTFEVDHICPVRTLIHCTPNRSKVKSTAFSSGILVCIPPSLLITYITKCSSTVRNSMIKVKSHDYSHTH